MKIFLSVKIIVLFYFNYFLQMISWRNNASPQAGKNFLGEIVLVHRCVLSQFKHLDRITNGNLDSKFEESNDCALHTAVKGCLHTCDYIGHTFFRMKNLASVGQSSTFCYYFVDRINCICSVSKSISLVFQARRGLSSYTFLEEIVLKLELKGLSLFKRLERVPLRNWIIRC